MHCFSRLTTFYDLGYNFLYAKLEYNIQVLTIEMTGRKSLCIRVQITAVTDVSILFHAGFVCVIF